MAKHPTQDWERPMDDEETGKFFIMGQPASNNEITSFLLHEFAQRGDAEAQFQLAENLHFGKGVPKDVEAALFWYKSAAEQGHVLAQNDLGSMLLDGIGGPPNPKEAVIWYRKAAMQENSTA
jgi:TPR repeat protein